MFARRLRSRMFDVVVAAVCFGCIAAPFVASAFAEKRPLVETSANVDQKVLQSAMISNPLNGSFRVDGSGRADGQVDWDVYTSADEGFKLSVATDRTPAMRDGNSGVDVDDYAAGKETPISWDVGSGEREFGFSAMGAYATSGYSSGSKWRGFTGEQGVEIARRTEGPVALSRTTLRLRAEFGDALPSGARPTVNITGTAVIHL